jgi:hypothetical protein
VWRARRSGRGSRAQRPSAARLAKEDSATPRVARAERFLPDLAARYERLVGEAERALQGDVESARAALRGFMGAVTMTPLAGGGLEAEARLDGKSLIRKCLGNQRNCEVPDLR